MRCLTARLRYHCPVVTSPLSKRRKAPFQRPFTNGPTCPRDVSTLSAHNRDSLAEFRWIKETSVLPRTSNRMRICFCFSPFLFGDSFRRNSKRDKLINKFFRVEKLEIKDNCLSSWKNFACVVTRKCDPANMNVCCVQLTIYNDHQTASASITGRLRIFIQIRSFTKAVEKIELE